MMKGPMTVTGFICYAQGWGGLYIRANKIAWKMQSKHPGLGIKNRFNVPDCPERVHWDEDFALEVGAPGAYDYGPERCSWLTHQITNWIGDDGFLRRGQRARPTSRRLRGERLQSLAAATRRLEPAVDRAAMHPETGDHFARPFALANTLNRHLADGFQRRVIESAAVSLHRGENTRISSICCLTF